MQKCEVKELRRAVLLGEASIQNIKSLPLHAASKGGLSGEHIEKMLFKVLEDCKEAVLLTTTVLESMTEKSDTGSN